MHRKAKEATRSKKLPEQATKALGDNRIRAIPYRESAVPEKPVSFTPSKFVTPDSFIIINGARGQGKSYAGRCLLWHMRTFFQRGFVMTNTKQNLFWSPHFPEDHIFDGFYEGVIDRIMKQQAKRMAQYNRDPKSINPFTLLVLEDVGTDTRNSDVLARLATTGRHFGMCIMVLTQRVHQLSTSVRDNADIVINLRTYSQSAKEAVWESWLGDLKLREAVQLQLTWCWKDPGTDVSQCLVVANRKGGNTVQDRVYAWIACDPGPFIIGSPREWGEESDDERDETILRTGHKYVHKDRSARGGGQSGARGRRVGPHQSRQHKGSGHRRGSDSRNR